MQPCNLQRHLGYGSVLVAVIRDFNFLANVSEIALKTATTILTLS